MSGVAVPGLTVLGRYGAYPAPGGAGRGVLLTGGPRQVLVGCGSGVAGRLGYHLGSPADLGAVLLPDLRSDHACDLWAVGGMAAAAVAAGTRRGLLPVYAFGQPASDWQRLHRPGVLDVRRFAPGDRVHAEGWTFTFAALDHPWPTLAMRAEGPGGAVAWVGPAVAPGAEATALCRGVALLLADVGGSRSGDEGTDGGVGASSAGELAAACGARRLLLMHLDPSDSPAALLEEAKAAFPGSALALEGRTYSL